MMNPCRCTAIGLCLGWVTLVSAPTGSALAHEDPSKYPTRAIHIVVGFTPGGGNDLIARIVGQKLSENLGQPIVIGLDQKPLMKRRRPLGRGGRARPGHDLLQSGKVNADAGAANLLDEPW